MENDRHRQSIATYNLPGAPVQQELQRLANERVLERIWQHDHTVWSASPEEISNRLGWLYSHREMAEHLNAIFAFVDQLRAEGYTHALLLGMGGSSLAPEVFRKTFGCRDGYLDLAVLDSTDPGAVREKEKEIDLKKTLFIISTKSGGTVETISLMKYFYNKTMEAVGPKNAGQNFIAITDPGSSLEKKAEALSFRKTFLNNPDIGGRYSVFSYFGLVPAALIGVDLKLLLHNASTMERTAEATNNPLRGGNTPAWLGAALGALGSLGRDKVTLILPPPIKPLGAWIEQLLAESTGKQGTGLLPVDGETLASPEVYAGDRLFVYFQLAGDTTCAQKVRLLKEAGQPVLQLNLQHKYDLGGEFFRWMMAAAVAGWSLGINPFDQPDVESAKVLAGEMVAAYHLQGELPFPAPDLIIDGIQVYGGHTAQDLQQVWRDFFRKADPGEDEGKGRSYIAIQAYLKPDPETDRLLQKLRDKIQSLCQMAVTVGYGPRFLHSTGQLHKGDNGKGLFIQLTAGMPNDIPIPDEAGRDSSSISFGVLKSAQALGDRQALQRAGREVISFHFNEDIKAAFTKLTEAV